MKSLRVNRVENGKAGAARDVACDAVLMCGGWTPCLHLFTHTKGSLAWDETLQAYLPGNKTEAVHIAGAGRGLWGIAAALERRRHRRRARPPATPAARPTRRPTPSNADRTGSGVTLKELPTDRNPATAKAFIDFQNDVTAKDIRLAVREGMRSIEHVKRYTTNGMATDQGKMSNINGLMIAADALGKPPPQVGLTTFRPPYTPTTFGTFAGYHQDATFEVTRKTPIDPWAEAHGAVFEPVALWRRAWYFPKPGEDMHAAVARECRATRASLGIFDASTLGKIEVVGPDAVTFMERMYTNPWAKLGVGRCRYGLLLGEDGFIRDDGVIGRLAADRFHVTTTTGGAARVLNMMEDYLQTEWPDLKVWLTSTTEQWATVALNGPNARKLLEPFVEGLDISDGSLPAHVGRRMHRRRLPGAALPRLLHRRARLRGQRPRPPRPRPLGEAHGGRPAVRHLPLRHRDHARAARREGLHHRRPGHRRHADPATTPASPGRSARRSPTSSASARSPAPTWWRRAASSSSAS